MTSVASAEKSGIFCLGTKITIYKASSEKVHVLRANSLSQIYGKDTKEEHLNITVSSGLQIYLRASGSKRFSQ